jgi:crotonobetainyl-CoA:carnitine CoA-transferase CaiB-like acyl-CoA transferase
MSALGKLLVLDVSRVLAGPYCGQFFADHGAEVIKIESPEGDHNRHWPILVNGASTNFFAVNRNKQDLVLDLRQPEGRAILHALARKADVLIHNYLPETARRLGVDDAQLEALNANLVRVVVGGYGAKGPLAAKPGYDAMVAGFSGLMALTGEPDRPPVRLGSSVIDLATGMLAYGAAMTALYARAEGRAKGQRVNVSLLETAVALLGFRATNYLMAGVVDRREGASFGSLAPYGCYRAGDGEMMIAAPTQAAWGKLCEVLGTRHWLDDPRFTDNDRRCANEPALRAALEAVLAGRSIAEWSALLDAAGVANAPVHTVDRALDHPQVRANDMVVSARSSDGREHRLTGLPFKLSATPGEIRAAPPELGEHSAAVLARHLGYTEAEIAALRAKGVIERLAPAGGQGREE